jgi:uncharacterized protein (TIGR03663 family)
VGTDSTKSRRKREQKRSAQSTGEKDSTEILTKRNWRIASAAILVTGAFLRLYDLALVPLHHDEGVNGNFLMTLVKQGSYQYDPQNYHGPTLYYFSATIPWICRFIGGINFGNAYGLTTFNIRFVTAAFGVATIGLVLLLRQRLGTIGALSAAGLIAISPGAVYFSRYFIHESLYVFFTLGIVVAALKYYDTARPVYVILSTVSASLMVATKETWIINGPVLLIALVTTGMYFWLREKFGGKRKRRSPASNLTFDERARQTIERFGGPASMATVVLVALAVFIMIDVLFYSSFFTNYPKGVHDALSTLNLWQQRTHEHEKHWSQYLFWLRDEESLLLILGAVGALIAVWRANNRLAVFVAQWAFGLLAAYSLVGYKTPWLTLNFIVPLAIVSGYTLDVAYEKLREFRLQGWFIAVALLMAGFCGYQMILLNFIHYDDDSYPYVYAHTRRQTLAMVNEIDRIAKRNGTGYDTGIAIVSPDYWPLPWYFRDYKHALFYGRFTSSDEPIVIGSVAQASELQATFGDRYQLINPGSPDGGYVLRPGVELLLYVRRDLAR